MQGRVLGRAAPLGRPDFPKLQSRPVSLALSRETGRIFPGCGAGGLFLGLVLGYLYLYGAVGGLGLGGVHYVLKGGVAHAGFVQAGAQLR